MSWVDVFWMTWWGKTLAYVSVAAVAGGIGYALRTANEGQRPTLWRTMLEVCAAGFVGLLFKLVCEETRLSDQWTGVIVGLAGWLGANASVSVLEQFVYDKLGIKKSPRNEENE
nr:MAG TPA: LydA holin phage, holin superfamily III [Caudoviricetes sp.]